MPQAVKAEVSKKEEYDMNRKKSENESQTLERGNIYFFARPRVNESDPESASDIQRFYMVLRPEQRKSYRFAIVGRKGMPKPSETGKDKYWGFVQKVRSSEKGIQKELEGKKYGTKTRGTQEREAARPVGEGVYRLVRHDGHTHLAYALELPRKGKRSKPQKEFNIADEASYVISVKNPEKPSPPSAGLGDHKDPKYSKPMMDKFRGRRFVEVDPPKYLDRQGTEFMIISAAKNVKDDLGIAMEPKKESEQSADIFRDLKADRSEIPVEPLFEGKWA